MAQRVYSRIRPSAAAQRLPAWRPSDALGAAGVGLFVRASGKRLSDGIPGFFTIDGFHKVLLPSLSIAARSVVSESWVLGQRVEFDTNGPQMRALERDVIALYEADYAPAWDAMLADLNVVQLRSLSQAAQDLYILASPQSPMRNLLVSIARQLSLSLPPDCQPSGSLLRPQVGAAMAWRSGCRQVLGKRPSADVCRDAAAWPRDRRTLQGADRSRGRGTRCADRSGVAIARGYAATACEDGRDTGQQRDSAAGSRRLRSRACLAGRGAAAAAATGTLADGDRIERAVRCAAAIRGSSWRRHSMPAVGWPNSVRWW